MIDVSVFWRPDPPLTLAAPCDLSMSEQHGGKNCSDILSLTSVCLNSMGVRNHVRGIGSKRLYQDGRIALTHSRLPDTDVVMYPGRVDKFETVFRGEDLCE